MKAVKMSKIFAGERTKSSEAIAREKEFARRALADKGSYKGDPKGLDEHLDLVFGSTTRNFRSNQRK